MSTDQEPAGLDRGLNWVRGGTPGGAPNGTPGGPPVMLLHSLGLDLTFWDRPFDALGRTREVIALDLPGHGRSPAPAAWSFDDAADRIAGLLAHLGVASAHVVGVSVGGMLAQTFALAHPERTRSLALLSTAATFADAGREVLRARGRAVRENGMAAATASLEQWLSADTRRRRPDLAERVTKTLLAGDAAAYAAACDAVADFETLGRLGGVRCPALVLTCADDPSTPPAAADAMAGALPDATRVVLPGGAHLSYLEQPDAVSDALSAFVAGVRA